MINPLPFYNIPSPRHNDVPHGTLFSGIEIATSQKVSEYLLQHASIGITLADGTQPDMPLMYVNPGFVQMTGYSASEVMGKNCRFLQGYTRSSSLLRVSCAKQSMQVKAAARLF